MNVGDVYFEKNIVTKVNTNGRGVEMETKRVDVIEIPENVTNGDMIKAMFPHIEIFEPNKYEIAIKQGLGWLAFKKEWWNAPYNKGE